MTKADDAAAIKTANGAKLDPNDYSAAELSELRQIAERDGKTRTAFDTRVQELTTAKADAQGENFRYTGQTTGHVVLDGVHVAEVYPGVVIAPQDTAHAALIRKSGHFEPTAQRATKVEVAAPVTADTLALSEAATALNTSGAMPQGGTE